MEDPLRETPASGTVTPAHHYPHIGHHSGRRLRQFFTPDGRRVHVATSPDEFEHHKRRLSSIVEEKDQFDIVLHGSQEHVEALRETHAHHERSREQLRAKHGDLIDEFERIHRDLDALSNELHNISDHAVQLDANFSKYGYSAHLRTRDSPNASSANSLMEPADDSSSQRDWDAERRQGQTMQFFRKPILRQYFHKGLLWRAQETYEVASYELFVDLFYVGIIAISGDGAAEEATGQALLRFAVTFVMSWKFWSDISTAIAWFDADDILRRLSVLFILTCLLGLTINMAASWDTTWTPLVAFYIAGRWFGSLYYLWMAYLVPMARSSMIGIAMCNFLPGFLWVGSIYVDEPNREALIWLGLTVDMFGIMTLMMIFRGWSFMPLWFRDWSKKHVEFYPGANIEHKIERTGAFVTLVFGYSVVALLYQSSAKVGINAFFGKAVLGLVQAFAFNWLYFEVDSFNLHTHAIRRHVFSAMIWGSSHLPFTMAFVLAGAALSKLVLAHDNPNADPHDLFGSYEERSLPEISNGLRWYYCAGLAIALACMSFISLAHIYKEIPNQRLSKPWRTVVRLAIAVVILLLPLTHRLNSLELIAITTSLVVFALVVELVGASCVHDPFWMETKRHCTYAARCHISKKELAARTKGGKLIDVEELARDGKGEKGGYQEIL
ncbi:hypothetical protein NA57DRAFT_58029 [Rhizodiscina lignyota]|uniref:Uncharacterized protein n=1 Tax=Rhizodiscina lignyota TaxID=1504668 RepID=A0A9P4IFA2_9PEZI|nr:hypothetical protein NA57DRAFT_58029 [Rhizodiscina lignyota]